MLCLWEKGGSCEECNVPGEGQRARRRVGWGGEGGALSACPAPPCPAPPTPLHPSTAPPLNLLPLHPAAKMDTLWGYGENANVH